MSATLDLNIIDTHNKKTIAIGDNSLYSLGMNIVSPTLRVTVPGYGESTVDFTPKSLNVYNSNTLNITDEVSENKLLLLPDGIWRVKYTINPAYDNYVEISFLKTDLFEEKLDTAFLSLEMSECDNYQINKKRDEISGIEDYLISAKSAARVCNYKLSLELYKMADKKLSQFIKNNCYGMSDCKM